MTTNDQKDDNDKTSPNPPAFGQLFYWEVSFSLIDTRRRRPRKKKEANREEPNSPSDGKKGAIDPTPLDAARADFLATLHERINLATKTRKSNQS